MIEEIFSQKSLLYSMITIVTLYIYHCFFETFFSKKKRGKPIFLIATYGIFFVITLGLFLFMHGGIINIIINIGMLFCITQFYKAKIAHKIFAVLIMIILMSSMEVFVPIMYSTILGIPMENVLVGETSLLIIASISRLIPLIIIKCYQFFEKSINDKRNKTLSKIYWITLIMIPTVSILIIHCIYVLSDEKKINNNWLVAVAIISVLFINILFYYLYDKLIDASESKLENALLSKQIDYYTTQYSQIESNWKESQRLRHDLKHNLINIQSKFSEVSACNTNSIKSEFFKLIDEIDLHEMIIYSGNAAIDTILNHEINVAKKKNIEIDIKVNISGDMNVEGKSLCIVLGNALDNAIEACEYLEEKLRKISIKIFEEKGNMYINISNSYLGKINFKDSFPVSIKRDKAAHGIGLRSINKMVNKLGGYMQINTENNIFLLEIILFGVIKGAEDYHIMEKIN